MESKVRLWIPMGLAVSMLAAACGPTATETPAPIASEEPADPLATYAPAAVTGPIISAGSSTVFPLSEAVAELFYDEGYTDQVTIDSIGSGAGFERFCVAGESDISNASRPIHDDEIASCQASTVSRSNSASGPTPWRSSSALKIHS